MIVLQCCYLIEINAAQLPTHRRLTFDAMQLKGYLNFNVEADDKWRAVHGCSPSHPFVFKIPARDKAKEWRSFEKYSKKKVYQESDQRPSVLAV